MPSIYIPPWAGGESQRRGRLGEPCAHKPPVRPPRTRAQPPLTASCVQPPCQYHLRQRRSDGAVARRGHRHIRQLLHHLRHREHGTLQDDVVGSDLGHVDHLLRHPCVDVPEHFHQLAHHQRHKNVKRRHPGSVVGKLLHGVPLNRLLRPDLEEPVRPRPARLFLVEAEELRLGCGGVPDRRRVVQLVPPPGTSRSKSKKRMMSCNCSTIWRQAHFRRREKSTQCSSSSGWGVCVWRGRGPGSGPCGSSRAPTPALAIVCPREEWCVVSARAIATVIRSCRSHERSRRCRRRCAAPETGCSLRSIPQWMTQKKALLGWTAWLLWLLWLLFVKDVNDKSVHIHDNMTVHAQQSLRLVDPITCVMSSYTPV